MDDEIVKIQNILEELLHYFDNREAYLEEKYNKLTNGNLMNQILMWIDSKLLEADHELNDSFNLTIRQPEFLLINELLNYIDLDNYVELVHMLMLVENNDPSILHREIPESHKLILEDITFLEIIQILLHAFAREFESAMQIVVELLSKNLPYNQKFLMLKTLKQVGKYLYKNSEFGWALKFLDVGEDLYKEIPLDSSDVEMEYGYILNLKGLVTHGIGKGPIEYYTQALNIFKELGNEEFQIHCFTNIGIYYWRAGDLELSEKYMKMAYDKHEERGNIWGMASTLSNLGVLMSKDFNFEIAIEYQLKAISLYNEITDRVIDSELANAFLGLASNLMSLGRYIESEEYFIKAMEIYAKVSNIHDYHKSALGYCYLKMRMREYHETINILETKFRKDELSKQQGAEYHIFEWYCFMLICHIEVGNLEAAEKYLEQLSSLEPVNEQTVAIQEVGKAYFKVSSDDLAQLAEAELQINNLLSENERVPYVLYAEIMRKLISIQKLRYEFGKNDQLLRSIVGNIDYLIKISEDSRITPTLADALFQRVEIDVQTKDPHLLISLSKLFEVLNELKGEHYIELSESLDKLLNENRDTVVQILSNEENQVLINEVKRRFT